MERESMKVALIGSRAVVVDRIGDHLTLEDEVVSGGAVGVDSCAARYAREHGMKLTEFLPQYERYGRAAPIVRNRQIVEYADRIIAFWDGKSRGTQSVIQYAKRIGKPCEVILCVVDGEESSSENGKIEKDQKA